MKRAVILISGRGSNMEAIVAATKTATNPLPIHVAAVISNRPDAKGLAIAQAAGVAIAAVDHKTFSSRAEFDAALQVCIDQYSPDIVVLAGFMRVLGEGIVRHYEGRMLNIHPSLLPLFPGLHTHEAALKAGVKVHGATVHFVTPELDHGPIVIQSVVPVEAHDTPDSLAAKLLVTEHQIYPQALRWFAEGRLKLSGGGHVTLANVADTKDSRHFIAPAMAS
jgi:phosphoribosylglycinamide formyltransferase 1